MKILAVLIISLMVSACVYISANSERPCDKEKHVRVGSVVVSEQCEVKE